MLEMKTTCESCQKKLRQDGNDAKICSYECTFCNNCAEKKFYNKCPNCNGELVKRPIRMNQN